MNNLRQTILRYIRTHQKSRRSLFSTFFEYILFLLKITHNYKRKIHTISKVSLANIRHWRLCKNGIISYCFWKDKYCIVSKFGISCHCAPTSEWYDRSIVSKHSPHIIMTMNHFGIKTKCSLWFEHTPYNSTPRNYKFIDLPTKNKHVPNAPATNWSTRIFLITVLVAVPGINFSKALYQVTYNGDSTSPEISRKIK